MSAVPRIALRSVLALAVAAALAFGIDAFVLHLARAPYGSVTVRSYYAVPTKDGRTDFEYNDAADQQCVHALFPHRGDSPCWYLQRHTDQRINVDTGGKAEYPH